MLTHRVSDAAAVLGVSDDTLRRWVDSGRIASEHDESGRAVIPGTALAALAQELADHGSPGLLDGRRAAAVSARNRMKGVVTRVITDTVMAQVEMVCGPYRVVSLMSSEAAHQLELTAGVIAVASVKSTNVVVELP